MMTNTVADRIYYAIDRAHMLRSLLNVIAHPIPPVASAAIDKGIRLESQVLDGLCDALEDIERVLRPLNEGDGLLPLTFTHQTVVPDFEPEPVAQS